MEDGIRLKLGVTLGEEAGSVDTDGPSLGPLEGYMLFDGYSLGFSSIDISTV